jgi:peptidyl-prolyl cis-trans isomerase C
MRTESRRVALPSGARTAGATLALVAASLTTVLLSGCSTGSNTLARVGDATISVEDFRAAAEAAAGRYPLPPDSAKVRLLEDMVQRTLLAQAAARSRLLIDSVVKKHRAQVEEQALMNALVQQLAPKEVPVSDAEVRALYDSRDTVTHCELIYAMDENLARGALAAVQHGEPFAAVADRFNPPGALPPGGDLGFVAPGTLVEPADRVIRTAPVGSVQGPLRGPGEGWFVVRIVERKRQPQPPFESEATRLRTLLEQRKQRIQAMRAFEGLKAQYRVATDPAGVAALFQHFNAPGQADSLGGEAPPPRPTPEQLKLGLGHWDGGAEFRGEYSMKDAFDDLEAGRGDPPNRSMMPAIDQWVEGRIIERVALVEARRRHLEAQPDVARRIRDAMDDYFAGSMYRWGVAERTAPTEEDVRASYQRNSGFFAHLASARFQYLTFPDSAMAVGAYARVQGSKSLRDAVLLSSASLQVHDEVVSYPSQDPVWSMLEGTLTHASTGAYFGPLHVPTGWRIVQLVSKDERVPKFEELPQNARQSLFEDAAQKLRNERFTVFIDSLRRAIPVTIDRKRLARVPWPASTMPAMPVPIGG